MKDGQRFFLELPVSEQLLHDEWVGGAGDFVRCDVTAELARHGIPWPEDAVVLCWQKHPFGGEHEVTERPHVWFAWGRPAAARDVWHGDAADQPPRWAESPDAELLIVSWEQASRAVQAWPDPLWFHEWHPTAKARAAAKRVGITAVLVGGPGNGYRVRNPHPPRFELPVSGPDWPSVIYVRDQEPTGIDDDGSALWFYRIDEAAP